MKKKAMKSKKIKNKANLKYWERVKNKGRAVN